MSSERYTNIGWWLFVVSAVLFGLSALRARDWTALAGAGAFLFANFSFMIARYQHDPTDMKDSRDAGRVDDW